MVQKQIMKPEVYVSHVVQDRQMARSKNVPKKTMVLMASSSAFQRFVDYTITEEKVAEQKEAAAAKLEAIKKATYEMSKTWDNTIENIKKRRKEELLSKSRKAEEERIQFAKDMAAKNAAERAEIVKQARKLLLYKQPQCRRINRALLVSECYRELDAQLAFRKKIREMEKEREDEYVKSMWKDVETFLEEEKKKADARREKRLTHNHELKEQIKQNERTRKDEEKRELELEIQDQKNMNRDLQLIKECQAQEVAEGKKNLREMYKELIEEKRRFANRAKTEEEFEDLAIEIYKKSKAQLKKMIKNVAKEEKQARERTADAIAATVYSNIKTYEVEEANYQKAKAELEALEEEKRRARKEFEEKMKAERLESKRQDDEKRQKIAQEKKEMQQWEIQQRFKQDECNKQVRLNEKIRERQKKLEQSRVLREHMALQEAEKKRVEKLDDDYETVKKSTEIVNNKVLSYAEEVLEECKGVRPLYPVLKAIEECKKEMGIREIRQQERPQTPTKGPRRRRGVRRAICNKTSGEMNSHYL